MTPTLIERIESAAGADQRELLIEAFEAIFPTPVSSSYDPVTQEWFGPAQWHELADRFYAMLDAEAYESAALMLVPEGAFWCLGHEGDCEAPSEFKARLIVPKLGSVDLRRQSIAATPALAICAAALKARNLP